MTSLSRLQISLKWYHTGLLSPRLLHQRLPIHCNNKVFIVFCLAWAATASYLVKSRHQKQGWLRRFLLILVFKEHYFLNLDPFKKQHKKQEVQNETSLQEEKRPSSSTWIICQNQIGKKVSQLKESLKWSKNYNWNSIACEAKHGSWKKSQKTKWKVM